MPKPADRLRSQVCRRINHWIERPTIERQLSAGANLRAASLIRGPCIGHTLSIAAQQEWLSANVHAFGRANIPEKIPTKLNPCSVGFQRFAHIPTR